MTDTDPPRTTRVPPSPCPYCGFVCDAATGVREEDDVPTAEDSVTVCIECASILFFNDDLTLRRPHLGEIEAIKEQGDGVYDMLWRAQQAVRLSNRRTLRRRH